MELSRDVMLERFYARDRAFDGRFVTGVLTTGIYCLPSCAARKPKPENVRFFAGEDDARGAGLRPCRRCRPGDFYRDYDPDLHLLETLASQVRRRPGAFPDVGDLAAASGVGQTKLHALFRRHFHATPAAFLLRERVAAATARLAAGASVADAADEAGYASHSAFHDAVRRLTGLTPGEHRRLGDSPSFTVALPDGYLAAYALRMIGRDTASLTERVDGTTAVKGLVLPGGPARLRMEFGPDAVACTVEAERTVSPDDVRAAHRAAVRMLHLAQDPAPFERRLDERGAARLLGERRGLRVPLTATVWEGMAWAIVGQQVNLAFAYELRRTVAELCARDAGDGLLAQPTAEDVAKLDHDDLTARRFSRRKAEYLVDTARLIAAGELRAEEMPGEMATAVERRLVSIRGLGPWSANYVMMRACGFGDCVPYGDTGLTMALWRHFGTETRPGVPETRALMEEFAPFRSLATHHLWMTLGDPA